MHPLNAELNPICHLLTLLGGATIVVVSRLRVKLHRTYVLIRKYLYMKSLYYVGPQHNFTIPGGSRRREPTSSIYIHYSDRAVAGHVRSNKGPRTVPTR